MDTNTSKTLTTWFIATVVIAAVIIATFVLYEDQMNQIIYQLIDESRHNYFVTALIILFLALDIFLPIPSSVLSTTSGTLHGVLLGCIVSWLGMTMGCLIAYVFGRKIGAPALSRLIAKNSVYKAQHLINEYGYWGIVLARPIPVLAETTAIIAGVASMSGKTFFLAISLSNLGISMFYSIAGAYLPSVATFWVIAGGISLPVLVWLISFTLRVKKTFNKSTI